MALYDGVVRQVEVRKGVVEEVAPQGGLLSGLHLGQVEVEALAAGDLGPAGVVDGQRGAEDGGRHGRAVDGDLRLVQVEAALAVHEEGDLAVLDGVVASGRPVGELQGALDRREPVPRRRQGVDEPVAPGVLVVVQVALGARPVGTGVEGVDEHVRYRCRAGDLYAGASQVLGKRRRLPVEGRRVRRRQMAGQDAVLQRPGPARRPASPADRVCGP